MNDGTSLRFFTSILARQPDLGSKDSSAEVFLRSRPELFLDFAFFERGVSGQAPFEGDLYFAFDQGTDVVDKLFIGHEAILRNPVARNKIFDVRDISQWLQAGGPND